MRILIAEDNAMNRELVAQLLEGEHELAFALDGVEACEQALRGGFDLVLMDLSLPRRSGLDATRALRSDPRTASVPIFALTAHAHAEHRREALAAGCEAYLTKPIDEDELLSAIERVAGRAQARREGALAPLRDNPALAAVVREHLPPLLAQAERASERGDLAALAAVGHQLKGGALMGGLVELAGFASATEAAARAGDLAAARSAAAQVVAQGRAVVAGLTAPG